MNTMPLQVRTVKILSQINSQVTAMVLNSLQVYCLILKSFVEQQLARVHFKPVLHFGNAISLIFNLFLISAGRERSLFSVFFMCLLAFRRLIDLRPCGNINGVLLLFKNLRNVGDLPAGLLCHGRSLLSALDLSGITGR